MSANEDALYRQAMWRWGLTYLLMQLLVFPVAYGAFLALPDSNATFIVMAAAFVGMLYVGFQFFAIWAEKKGYSASYGWLTLFPVLGLVAMFFLPSRERFK